MNYETKETKMLYISRMFHYSIFQLNSHFMFPIYQILVINSLTSKPKWAYVSKASEGIILPRYLINIMHLKLS